MTQDRELLYGAWLTLRSRPRWLATMSASLGLDADDESYLNGLEGALADFRDVQHQSEDRARALCVEFRSEVEREEPDMVAEARRSFLRGRIDALKASIAAGRIAFGFLALRAKSKEEGAFLVAMSEDPAEHDLLKNLTKALAFIGRSISHGRVTDQQVEAARAYPLWKLLDRKAGERIACPRHDDEKKTLALYEDGGGYCFRCNKSVNAIGWLMEFEGLAFFEAVRRLA